MTSNPHPRTSLRRAVARDYGGSRGFGLAGEIAGNMATATRNAKHQGHGIHHDRLMMVGGAQVPGTDALKMFSCVPPDRCDNERLLDYSVNFTARKIVR